MNIVEILKDYPKGTPLYSPIFGDVLLHSLGENKIVFMLQDKTTRTFNRNGQYTANAKRDFPDSECMLFFSKERRDWSSFVPEYSFTPFEKVLVRDSDKGVWVTAIFSHMDKDCSMFAYKYVTCGGVSWKYCLPFSGNAHLLGTIAC